MKARSKKTKASRKGFKKFISPLQIAAGLVLLVLIAVSWSGLRHTTTQPRYPYRVWQSGEVISDQQLSFVVGDTHQDTIGIPRVWTTPPDSKFFIVDMSFTNKTGRVYHLSPIINMKLRDSDNHEYSVTSAPTIQTGLGGPVDNNQTVTGEVGFIVPKKAQKLQLVFDPKIIDENVIIVNLQ